MLGIQADVSQGGPHADRNGFIYLICPVASLTPISQATEAQKAWTTHYTLVTRDGDTAVCAHSRHARAHTGTRTERRVFKVQMAEIACNGSHC